MSESEEAVAAKAIFAGIVQVQRDISSHLKQQGVSDSQSEKIATIIARRLPDTIDVFARTLEKDRRQQHNEALLGVDSLEVTLGLSALLIDAIASSYTTSIKQNFNQHFIADGEGVPQLRTSPVNPDSAPPLH